MGLDSFNVLRPSRASSVQSRVWDDPGVIYRVIDRLSVPDLCVLASVSRKFKSLVYDESIWTKFIANIGLQSSLVAERSPAPVVLKAKTVPPTSNTGSLLDLESDIPTNSILFSHGTGLALTNSNTPDLSPLDCIDKFQYHSGHAREAFVSLYRTLAPYYLDLTSDTRGSSQPLVFSAFPESLDQARLLKQLKVFANADPNEDSHRRRISTLQSVTEIFENAALQEFETAMNSNAHEKLKEYVTVLTTLNGSDGCIQLFLSNHRLIANLKPEKSLRFYTPDTGLDSSELRSYFSSVADEINDSSKLIDSVFPLTDPVTVPLIEQVIDGRVMETITNLLEDIYDDSVARYLRAVPTIYSLLMDFGAMINASANSGPHLSRTLTVIINDRFHNTLNSYLSEELQAFTLFGENEVQKWVQTISEDEAAAESFLWSSVSKEKDKSDFLSSFKKVIMMPVSAISKSDDASNSGASTPTSSSASIPATKNKKLAAITILPTTELDAMVAVMNNKLEGIKTLFSLELAINLIRMGKEVMERISQFAKMEGEEGVAARKQCEAVFVELVNLLGGKHVMGGFSKALDTLSKYDPKRFRKTVETEENGTAVELLAIFAELINIGDLIQQMIHVFYEEELAQRKLVDKNNFLSPAVKAKKRFEQKLDDSVAEGLSLGIDVLIDQVDFTLVTQQPASDFNPPPSMMNNMDIGPTDAAKKVVLLLRSHMALLVGSTDKSVLDVFQQEVGLRFYGSICKQMKRKVINTTGAIRLISDFNYYYDFIASLKQYELLAYFAALKEVGQLFLIDGSDAKALGQALSDLTRFRGVMKPDELLEFVQQRADWLAVKREVERVMFGFGLDCVIM